MADGFGRNRTATAARRSASHCPRSTGRLASMADEGTVHVIDDDPAVRDSLAFIFDVAGLDVQTWESAVAFLAALDGIGHGCIVTDVRMPDMTGLELVQRLK